MRIGIVNDLSSVTCQGPPLRLVRPKRSCPSQGLSMRSSAESTSKTEPLTPAPSLALGNLPLVTYRSPEQIDPSQPSYFHELVPKQTPRSTSISPQQVSG